jgi:transcriptional regulator with XRE-family HTH domain
VPKSASQVFAERLRQLRKERGWTQEKASEKIGLSAKLYQFYELGVKKNPGLLTLEKIARGFGVEVYELLKRH